LEQELYEPLLLLFQLLEQGLYESYLVAAKLLFEQELYESLSWKACEALSRIIKLCLESDNIISAFIFSSKIYLE